MNAIDALIAAIDEDPDDDERYLVPLTAAGVPRGELIVLQHERAKRPHDRALERAEREALRNAWRARMAPPASIDVRRFHALERLSLRGAAITADGVAELRDALPACRVTV